MSHNPENIKIMGDRILVKQLKYDEKVGSFYVPENVRDRKLKRRKDAWKGEVVSCGDGVSFEYLRHRLKPKDVVYLEPVSLDCPSFEYEGHKYVIVTQMDVCATEVA
jgi:co-chaperonin GroES (HSP10)